MPENPRAWLVSAGHFKAPDTLRRDARYDALDHEATGNIAAPEADEPENIEDDRLRLIFTCCHPALNADAQAALTLREVCTLTTEEIARAYLTPAPTITQRIARTKAKIRDAKIPEQVPSQEELPGRLDGVLRVVYLAFNEGYAATGGDTRTRVNLSSEAIRQMIYGGFKSWVALYSVNTRPCPAHPPEPLASTPSGAPLRPSCSSTWPRGRRPASPSESPDQDNAG